MDLRNIHTPVLLERCVELLTPALSHDGAVLVDATLGMGGHSEAFLERLPGLHLIGLDRDPQALAIAGERLARFADRITLVHTVYDGIAEAVAGAGFAEVDGILFDLGVSSLQLDRAERAPGPGRRPPVRGARCHRDGRCASLDGGFDSVEEAGRRHAGFGA